MVRVLEAEPAPQPELPAGDWPDLTRRWWSTWACHPLAHEFTALDWSFLLDTARIHAAFVAGELKLAAELRLRVAKYGTTPEDRARLRITFATAERVDPPQADGAEARARFGPLKAVPDQSPRVGATTPEEAP